MQPVVKTQRVDVTDTTVGTLCRAVLDEVDVVAMTWRSIMRITELWIDRRWAAVSLLTIVRVTRVISQRSVDVAQRATELQTVDALPLHYNCCNKQVVVT